MAIDHSRTYTSFKIRNFGHMWRAREISRAVRRLSAGAAIYCDVGCSNGFLTARLADEGSFSLVIGLDHAKDNLDLARNRHPHIDFRLINLNVPCGESALADFVTCFETMEHVGNVDVALGNVYRLGKPGARFLFTVPIEVGWLGIVKYLAKTRLFGYSLVELSPDAGVWKEYERALLHGKDISMFRNVRQGWGTHFGFDYRYFESCVKSQFSNVKAWTAGTSRFLSATK